MQTHLSECSLLKRKEEIYRESDSFSVAAVSIQSNCDNILLVVYKDNRERSLNSGYSRDSFLEISERAIRSALSISHRRSFTEAITAARRQAGRGEGSEDKGMGH